MKKVFLLSFVFLLLTGISSITQAQSLHTSFDGLLSKYVNDEGKVDYIGFNSDISVLDTYLEDLSNNKPSNKIKKGKQLVFWINLYNASTIKLILKNYPVESITDIANGKPWDLKWIKVGKEIYSLNEIENDIIRPQFNEPRIHFAVNCAAQSCPPLMNRSWEAFSLEQDLEKMTKRFIQNEIYNTLNKENINISKIFDWYKSDFSDLLRFINKYSTPQINLNAKINYKPYNWKLNKQ